MRACPERIPNEPSSTTPGFSGAWRGRGLQPPLGRGQLRLQSLVRLGRHRERLQQTPRRAQAAMPQEELKNSAQISGLAAHQFAQRFVQLLGAVPRNPLPQNARHGRRKRRLLVDAGKELGQRAILVADLFADGSQQPGSTIGGLSSAAHEVPGRPAQRALQMSHGLRGFPATDPQHGREVFQVGVAGIGPRAEGEQLFGFFELPLARQRHDQIAQHQTGEQSRKLRASARSRATIRGRLLGSPPGAMRDTTRPTAARKPSKTGVPARRALTLRPRASRAPLCAAARRQPAAGAATRSDRLPPSTGRCTGTSPAKGAEEKKKLRISALVPCISWSPSIHTMAPLARPWRGSPRQTPRSSVEIKSAARRTAAGTPSGWAASVARMTRGLASAAAVDAARGGRDDADAHMPSSFGCAGVLGSAREDSAQQALEFRHPALLDNPFPIPFFNHLRAAEKGLPAGLAGVAKIPAASAGEDDRRWARPSDVRRTIPRRRSKEPEKLRSRPVPSCRRAENPSARSTWSRSPGTRRTGFHIGASVPFAARGQHVGVRRSVEPGNLRRR